MRYASHKLDHQTWKFSNPKFKTKTKTISQTNIIKTPHTSLKPKHSLLIINISFTTNTNQQQYAKQMHNHFDNHWPIQLSLIRTQAFILNLEKNMPRGELATQ